MTSINRIYLIPSAFPSQCLTLIYIFPNFSKCQIHFRFGSPKSVSFAQEWIDLIITTKNEFLVVLLLFSHSPSTFFKWEIVSLYTAFFLLFPLLMFDYSILV